MKFTMVLHEYCKGVIKVNDCFGWWLSDYDAAAKRRGSGYHTANEGREIHRKRRLVKKANEGVMWNARRKRTQSKR